MGFSPVALRVPVACLATRHNQGTILSRPICPFTCRAEDIPQPFPGLEAAALEILKSDCNFLAVAGPRAGKAEMLADRASFLLETGICAPPHRILAISFKRHAAKNLKDRVGRRCGEEPARRFGSYTFAAWAKSILDPFRFAPSRSLPTHKRLVIDFDLGKSARLEPRLLAIAKSVGVTLEQVRGLDLSQFHRRSIVGTCVHPEAKARPGTDRSASEPGSRGRRTDDRQLAGNFPDSRESRVNGSASLSSENDRWRPCES
jgi:hypothetical protein